MTERKALDLDTKRAIFSRGGMHFWYVEPCLGFY